VRLFRARQARDWYRSAEVEESLARLAEQVHDRLRGTGWERSADLPWQIGTFTLPLGDGFTATLEIVRCGEVRLPKDGWPVDVFLRFGCGFESVSDLLPRVGLEREVSLLEERPVDQDVLRLPDRGSIAAMADRISARVSEHGLGFAQRHASPAAIRAGLQDRDVTPLDVEIELLPVLLAASGDFGEAGRLIDRYVREGVEGASDPEYTRFAGRLREWMRVAAEG
jgi:hypothetical protein